MQPYFIFKDAVTLIAGLLIMAVLVFYVPNVLGHSNNYIEANPMSTHAYNDVIGCTFAALILLSQMWKILLD